MAKAPHHTDAAADVLAIFGISGDLAKKMTFRALYRLEARDKLECPIVGVAIDEWDDAQLRAHAREAITATVSDPDEEVIASLEARLSYVQGDYADAATFERVEDGAGRAQAPGLLPRDPALAVRDRRRRARRGRADRGTPTS